MMADHFTRFSKKNKISRLLLKNVAKTKEYSSTDDICNLTKEYMLDLTSLYIQLEKTLNSRHFVTPPVVSPRNDLG